MATALWVREKPDGKGGGQDERGLNYYRNAWTVMMSDPTAMRVDVLACGLLPVYGSPNAEDFLAVCTRVDAVRDKEQPRIWHAEAEWHRQPDGEDDPADDQKPPDERRPKWSSRFIAIPVSRFLDYAGNLLCDTAWTPFDPVPDMPIYAEEVTIFQYERTAGRLAKRNFMGKTNSDPWQGAQPGEALVDDISTAPNEFIQGSFWWATTYKILICPYQRLALPQGGETWVGGFEYEYILNAGPMALVKDPNTGKIAKKAVLHGNFYDGRPALLAQDGTEIPLDPSSGKPYDPISKKLVDPFFLECQKRQEAAFSDLNLTPPSGWTG